MAPLLALVLFSSCAAPGRERVTMERSDSGEWRFQGDPGYRPLGLHLFKASYETSTGATSVIAGSTPQRLLCRRIVLWNEIGHPAAAYAALAAQKELQALPFVERVDYVPAGEPLPAGEGLPDLVLRFRVEDYDLLLLPFYHGSRLSIVVDSGLSPLMVEQARGDGWNLYHPWVGISWGIRMLQDATLLGATTENLGAVATNIGESLGESLCKELSAWAAKWGILGIPAYAEGDLRSFDESDVPILVDLNARELLEGKAPLHHHMSVWLGARGGPMKERVLEMTEAMKGAGWDVRSNEIDGDLQCTRGARRVVVRVLQSAGPSLAMLPLFLNEEPRSTAKEDPPGAVEASVIYAIFLIERFEDEEVESLVQRLDDDVAVGEETKAAFANLLPPWKRPAASRSSIPSY